MTEYQIYTLAISTIGAIVIIATLLLSYFQLKLLVGNHRDNHEWNRRIETQKAMDEHRNMDLQKLNETFGFKDRKEPIPLKEINKAFDNDRDLENQCIRILNAYEGLAAGLKLGIFDEDVIKINRKGNMERTYIKFKEYIEHRRHYTKSTTYLEYQRLIEGWIQEEMNSGFKSPIGK